MMEDVMELVMLEELEWGECEECECIKKLKKSFFLKRRIFL
jgi:hypothetical protein